MLKQGRTAVQSGVCHRCQEQVLPSQNICECGAPAPTMSFKERCEFEVRQWRSYTGRMATRA